MPQKGSVVFTNLVHNNLSAHLYDQLVEALAFILLNPHFLFKHEHISQEFDQDNDVQA